MLKLFLWLRYLGKRKVVLLSIAAVAISCALLITVASIFTGFIDAFEQIAVDTIGDIVVALPEKIPDYQQLNAELEKLKPVEAATATLSAQGLLHLGAGNVRAVELWGIEVQKQGKVTTFNKSLLKGGEDANKSQSAAENKAIEGYISIGLLEKPNEETDEYDFNAAKSEIGRDAVITTGSIDGKQQFKRKTIRLEIADVVFTGYYYLDSRIVYMPIDRLSDAVYPDSKQPVAGQIHIKLRRGVDEKLAMAQIRGVWEVFASAKLGLERNLIDQTRIATARQMQAMYVAEFRKQMGVLLLIFGVVSLSAVLLVFCIFYMIVETRRRDVAILKSCGATSTTVAVIFTGFGLFIGAIGTLLGTALGYVVTKNINIFESWIRVLFGLKLWKASVYMFSKIPNEVDWHAVVWIALAAIAGAALGALIPAISAAIIRPVNVLRYE
jgi:lipoprotein-releasing system permease protein